jgi:GNAT superfamily N-acetyltransferase
MLYLICHEVRRRVHSTIVYIIFRRDLSVNIHVTPPEIPLHIRPLDKKDVPKLLDIYAGGLNARQIWERIRILRMIKSDIKTPYVVVTDRDEPCHIAWLIDYRENERMQSYFRGRIPLLKPDEVVFEFVFTLEQYRGSGIQSWRIHDFISRSSANGAKAALVFIKDTNLVSINNVLKNGFKPYMIRTDHWRFFRCRFQFKPYLEEERSIEHGKKP